MSYPRGHPIKNPIKTKTEKYCVFCPVLWPERFSNAFFARLAPSALHGRFSRASSPFGLLRFPRVLRICEYFNTVKHKSQHQSVNFAKIVVFAKMPEFFRRVLCIFTNPRFSPRENGTAKTIRFLLLYERTYAFLSNPP